MLWADLLVFHDAWIIHASLKTKNSAQSTLLYWGAWRRNPAWDCPRAGKHISRDVSPGTTLSGINFRPCGSKSVWRLWCSYVQLDVPIETPTEQQPSPGAEWGERVPSSLLMYWTPEMMSTRTLFPVCLKMWQRKTPTSLRDWSWGGTRFGSSSLKFLNGAWALSILWNWNR